MNTTLRSAARSRQTHTRLVQLAQRSQENGEGVSSGRCEVNNCVCYVCVCVCVFTQCESVCGCCVWGLFISSVFVCAHSRIYISVAALSPVHNAVSVEGHKVDLTAAARTHWRKKHLKERKKEKNMIKVDELCKRIFSEYFYWLDIQLIVVNNILSITLL